MKMSVKKHQINSLDYVFTFGKFKGSTAADVLHDEPQYFQWLEDNEVADIDPEIMNNVYVLKQSELDSPSLWDLPDLD